MTSKKELLRAFVEREYAGRDASHDAMHVWRVAHMAARIATIEGDTDADIVHYGALFHDITDKKYTKDKAAAEQRIREFLEGDMEMQRDRVTTILQLIDNVSYSKEVAMLNKTPVSRELAAVQDADRLDALGAIGIARAFTFGGANQEPMYDAQDADGTIMGHIQEKLTRLRALMKTDTGREYATKREKFVTDFMAEFLREWGQPMW